MEGFDEVAFVVEAAGDRYLLDRNILCGKHFAGAFDPVIVQIIDGRPLGHTPEIPAEILGIHPRDPGQIVETDIIVIVFGNIGENIFDRGQTLGA